MIITIIPKKKQKKTWWSIFKDGVQLSEDCVANMRKSFLFTRKSPGVSGTHLVHLPKMKGWVNFGATQSFLTTQWFSTLGPWIQYPNH